MRSLFLIASAALALAGCKKAETTDSAAAPTATTAAATPSSAPMLAAADYVGTWDYATAEGEKGVTEFNADGSYKDESSKTGKSIGRYTVKDGKICMAPASEKGETCYTAGPTGADGMIPMTGSDGSKVSVKKRAA